MSTKYYHCKRCNIDTPAINRHIIRDMIGEFGHRSMTYERRPERRPVWVVETYIGFPETLWFTIKQHNGKYDIYNFVDRYHMQNRSFHDACSYVRYILTKPLPIS